VGTWRIILGTALLLLLLLTKMMTMMTTTNLAWAEQSG
jgi:hypothetical protein